MKKLNKITIVGVGLIGGSFAKAIKKLGLAEEVVGFGKNESNLQTAIKLDVIDSYSTDIAEAVKGSDLVFLAVPLGVMKSVLNDMKPYLSESTIITDGGSAKSSVILSAQEVFGELPKNFVPGHPIAGKEKSGVTAADADLYIDHRVILTPTATTSKSALNTVKQLWSLLGANVEIMNPQRHDEIFAATSHLPHLLAFTLVDMLNEHEELGDVFQYTAGGFRDFTRIASSDAIMWRDIAMYNSDAIVKWLKNYSAAIENLTGLVESKESETLYHLFNEAKKARDKHIVN
ncbi:MAG TPA: prephenate dehydrogenase/arogenate dehydrogenase family protein [Thiomicrospira sp.]|nr:prephenate dehydrogenase/arogenate dehydrogenase family protein [Thiomicrospira sp.]